MHVRKAITIYDEDSAVTILKPLSGEHTNELFVVYEDAYGEATGVLAKMDDMKLSLNLTNEEFEEILKELST